MKTARHPCVYILSSKIGGTLYVGVTSDLVKRIHEHKSMVIAGFTRSHDVTRLVHFEQFEDMDAAIAREKRLKKWKRRWRISLIEERNPQWVDLYPAIATP